MSAPYNSHIILPLRTRNFRLSLLYRKKSNFSMIPAILRLKSGGSSRVKHRASGHQKNLKQNCSRDAENRGISRQLEAVIFLRHSQTHHFHSSSCHWPDASRVLHSQSVILLM